VTGASAFPNGVSRRTTPRINEPGESIPSGEARLHAPIDVSGPGIVLGWLFLVPGKSLEPTVGAFTYLPVMNLCQTPREG
jgi:hypothetical protein